MTPALPPPNLNDPAERAAYQKELRMVTRPIRWMGVALAIAAAVLAGLRARYWPEMPMILPLFLIGMAILHVLAGVVVRMKYHRVRMGE
ncbi:MAG: hypothetical protein ACRCS5_10250 [Sphingomonas sp.]|uniref:hypothetical protein n=1 Tax=Sphingomonas sp. TaxID=28214 RepID=UPI0030F6F1BF